MSVDEKGLRKFAFTLFSALTILGGMLFWRHGKLSLIPVGIGVALLGTGITRPSLIRPVYKIWMAFAMVMAFITNHLLLAIVYYFVFTPIGLVMKVLGRDPLQRKFDPRAQTYWKKREKKHFSEKQYEKMF